MQECQVFSQSFLIIIILTNNSPRGVEEELGCKCAASTWGTAGKQKREHRLLTAKEIKGALHSYININIEVENIAT